MSNARGSDAPGAPSAPPAVASAVWRGLEWVWLAGALAVLYALAARWHFKLDDMYISLRYARNLHEGHGLVWNPGERPVEGYTNFLWVLIEALHYTFTRYPEHYMLLYNRVCGLGVIAVVWWWMRGWGGIARDWMAFGLFAVALHQTMNSWMTGGLETTFFALLTTLTAVQFLREEAAADEGRITRFRWSGVWLSLALLTRPEAMWVGALVAATIALRVQWPRRADDPRPRRTLDRATLIAIALVLVTFLSHMTFRRLYYDAWVPNTFVAKVPGAHFKQGIPYVLLFCRAHYLHGALVAVVLALGWLPALVTGARPRDVLARRFLATFVAGFLLYMMYVGGDHFEFRLLAPSVPAMGMLLALVFAEVSAALRERVGRFAGIAAPLLLAAALLARQGWTAKSLYYENDLYSMSLEFVGSFQSWNRVEFGRQEGRWMKQFTDPREPVAVRAAGIIAFAAERPAVDVLGLNDYEIARMPLPKERTRIGHERVVTPEYLAKRGIRLCETGVFAPRFEELRPELRADNSLIAVRLLDNTWAVWYCPQKDPGDLRAELRRRGAIVGPGPKEDAATVAIANSANAIQFERFARREAKTTAQRLAHERRIALLDFSARAEADEKPAAPGAAATP